MILGLDHGTDLSIDYQTLSGDSIGPKNDARYMTTNSRILTNNSSVVANDSKVPAIDSRVRTCPFDPTSHISPSSHH